MTVYATRHTVVYFTSHDCWIGVRPNLKPSYTVVVNIVSFIVALQLQELFYWSVMWQEAAF